VLKNKSLKDVCVMKHISKCERCGGNIVEFRQYEGPELQCLMCGRKYEERIVYRKKTAA